MSDVLVIDAVQTPISTGSEVHDVLVFSPTTVGAAQSGGADTQFVVFDVATTVGASTALAADFIIWDTIPAPVAELDTGLTDFLVITSSGPKGDAGTDGASAFGTYVHTQTAPAATWIISHNLHRRPAVVTVLDTDAGQQSVSDVSYPDLDTVSIQFPEPVSGVAEM